MNKKRNIFGGLLFVLVAFLVVFYQMGFLNAVGLPTLIFTVLLIPVIIISIVHRNFGGIFFPLAVLCIFYDNMLGIEALTPWPVLLIALLLSIGLSMLFPNHKWHKSHHEEHFETVIDEPDDSEIIIEARFSGSVKYINTNQLKTVNLYGSYGGVKVFFDHADMAGDSAVINVDMNFAGAELYIPNTWRVVDNVNYMLAGLDEEGAMANTPDKTLIINGRASFAGITIKHI